MEKQILNEIENLTDEEVKEVIERLKKRIFRGGVKELNPEKKQTAMNRYFEYAIGTTN
ncbi:MAG: hypothetical protein AB6733_12365 [Clostridiaceae bacterium]